MRAFLIHMAPVALPALAALTVNARNPLSPIRYRRVGGLRFIRLGRISFSFCIARRTS